jgi:hypothetical protein
MSVFCKGAVVSSLYCAIREIVIQVTTGSTFI